MLVRWRVSEEFRMREPGWLISHGVKARTRDTRNLILRFIAVAFLAVLLWHTVIATGWP
jgi:hypothetical protein